MSEESGLDISEDPEVIIRIFGIAHRRDRLPDLRDQIRTFSVDRLDGLEVEDVNVFFPADERMHSGSCVLVNVRCAQKFWDHDKHWDAVDAGSGELYKEAFIEPLAKKIHAFVHPADADARKTVVEFVRPHHSSHRYLTIKQ